MILRVIVITLLLLLVIRAVRLLIGGIIQGGSARARPPAPPVKLVRDPVCGTHVTARASLSVTARGQTHYFCSEECRSQFQAGR